jgi:hypothetical protein
MAQSPVKAQSGAPQITAPTSPLDPTLPGGSESKPPFILAPKRIDASVSLLKNSALSTAVFIENVGQFDSKVRYQVKIGGQTAWLTTDGVVFEATRPRETDKPETLSKAASFANAPTSHSTSVALDGAGPSSRTVDRLVFAEDFVKASCCSKVEAKGPREGAYNYFQGGGPSKWRMNAHGYGEVVYRDVWPGIDLRIYGNGSDLEQEFVVQPAGDLSRVQISYRGIDKIDVAQDGSLEINTAFGKLRETKPRIYQQIGGNRAPVDGEFKLLSETSYSFKVGSHSPLYALVIDPTLLYSTFLGGSSTEQPVGVAVDASGNAYVAGNTSSTDFPTTPGAFQVSPASRGFITKLNATGSALLYSTYLGYATSISAIAVDAAGQAYVTGYTADTSYGQVFPTTSNAYWPTNAQQRCAYYDFFMTKLNSIGSQLVYSTCLNTLANDTSYGSYPHAIAVDQQGSAYITGQMRSDLPFPTTANAYQPSYPNGAGSAVFVTVFDTTRVGVSSLLYSTYLGTSIPAVSGSSPSAIAVDSFGKLYVTGAAYNDFPVTAGALQSPHGICTRYCAQGQCGLYGFCPEAFVAKLDPSASGSQSLIYSTVLSGGTDAAGTSTSAIAVDGSGSAYVTGTTTDGAFPVTPGAFRTTGGGGFVTKLNAGGSQLLYSSYLAPCLSIGGIALDALSNAWVVGSLRYAACLTILPVTPDAFKSTHCDGGDPTDAFLTGFNPTGSGLVYSTYLCGSTHDSVATGVAADRAGDVYVTGYTESFDFPITSTAFQPALKGSSDVFVTKFPLSGSQTLAVSSLTPTLGGNSGTVSPQIFGTGFHAGATAKLNCSGRPITGANLMVGPGGRFLNTTFDLTGAPPGKCDVVVTNPDGTSATLSQAFTVQQGGAPSIRIYLTGVKTSKVPTDSSAVGPANAVVLATVSNRGDVDLNGGFVFQPTTPPFAFTSASPPPVDSTSLSTDSSIVWSLPSVAAGQSQVLTATSSSSQAVSSALVAGPACFLTPVSISQLSLCIADDPELQADCAPAGTTLAFCGIAGVTCWPFSPTYNPYLCGISLKQCLSPTAYNKALACWPHIQACLQQASTCVSSILSLIAPADPNNLTGPPGVGGQRWMTGPQALSYVVSFDNEPSATAPAQQVVVTQPLGPNVNLSTLALLGITIPNGSTNIQVPIPAGSFNPSAGVDEFITNVDLRPNQSLLVNVDAKLNPAAQTLTWTLTSIDPTTGLPPFNPLVGFLPAGAGANVSFSVTPTPGLATGTQVTEQATVVFDGQTPMSTAIWVNTIDNSNPASHVLTLPATSSCPNFRVSWSGSDVGSGLQGFTVYVSDTGGPFTPWLSNTTAAAATYIGAAGHTYSFYSIATDLTGNVESAKTSAEASTSVSAAGSCGPPSLNAQMLNVTHSGTTVTANLQLTNTGFTAAQTVNIKQITLRTLSGTGTVALSSPALPLAVGPLAIGATTTVPLAFSVPSTATRFSVTEAGTVQDASGNGYSYTIAQTIIP